MDSSSTEPRSSQVEVGELFLLENKFPSQRAQHACKNNKYLLENKFPSQRSQKLVVYESVVKRDVRSSKWRRSKTETETVASMGNKLGAQLVKECTVVGEAWALLA
jgi:hypothetical protein